MLISMIFISNKEHEDLERHALDPAISRRGASLRRVEWIRRGGKWIVFDDQIAIETLARKLAPFIYPKAAEKRSCSIRRSFRTIIRSTLPLLCKNSRRNRAAARGI